MSLDVSLRATRVVDVYEDNITHNLAKMAEAAGLYMPLWRPEELTIRSAEDLIPLLTEGLAKLTADPDKFKALSPENGWGSYEGLARFVAKYLHACQESPDAEVIASR